MWLIRGLCGFLGTGPPNENMEKALGALSVVNPNSVFRVHFVLVQYLIGSVCHCRAHILGVYFLVMAH